MKAKLILFLIALSAVLFSCKKDKSSGPQYGSVTDIEGNVYQTLKIGDQEWMVENLKVTHYNTGTTAQDEIPLVLDEQQWSDFGSFLSTGAYCYYDKDQNNLAKYGALYNGYAVKSGKLAPTGWHVPNDADWQKLRDYLIANGYNYDGTLIEDKVAKSLAAINDWNTYQDIGTVGNQPEKNNKSGFNALPGGSRIDGTFEGLGTSSIFWSSSVALNNVDRSFWRLQNFAYELIGPNQTTQSRGYSVRCVKD